MLETFRSPPARYGPAPLLVFNDEHEGVAGEERITKVLARIIHEAVASPNTRASHRRLPGCPEAR